MGVKEWTKMGTKKRLKMGKEGGENKCGWVDALASTEE